MFVRSVQPALRSARSLHFHKTAATPASSSIPSAFILISQAATNRTMSTSQTPVQDAIHTKITESLAPTKLTIHNDSSRHAHHAAMHGSTSAETHFRLHIVSSAFEGKTLMARHRMVNSLLGEELRREGGVHALQMITRTEAEEEKVAATARRTRTGE